AFDALRGDLPQAVSALSYRGPDDSGLFFDEKSGVGLGHTRLAVIDLSEKAHQPMASDDVPVWMSYNGQVYNFKQLREHLAGRGHSFSSNSDTYLEWGVDCFAKFTGMFALAIWDGRSGEVILARDRIGIKPLYYSYGNGTLLFASELKGLMAFESFKRDIDPEAIPLFLHYQYIPAPRTIFKDTFKLHPGRYLIFNGRDLISKAFSGLPDMGGHPSPLKKYEVEERAEELDEFLRTVVSDHLVSDVPLGALLSGGIDSSVVVAFMQKVSTSPVRTFTMGFKEKGYNEAPWASKVAEHLGTDHTELYVTPKEALDVIPSLPEIYDEPFADSSAIPTYLVCRLARSEVKVAVTGDGGDEQFSGYVRYWSTRAMAQGVQRIPGSVRKAISLLLRYVPPQFVERCYLPLRELLPQRFRVANFPDKWQKLINQMGNTELQELYRMTISLWSEREISDLTGEPLSKGTFEQAFKETDGWPLLSRLMRIDQKTYLPDAMMTKADRASMAASLEVRVPLLDNRIVAYTAALPENLKYRNGTGKYLLKKLLARYVPPTLFKRPKMGFGAPIDRWFRGDLKPLLLDYLSPERLKNEGLFDHEFVEDKIREHLSGTVNHHYRLWALLMWEMWREKWLG
ncbi:MAG: asparagine synthase (glutamine-hydrolyzing), partial [Deltaproteobacteria bacterium]|nr:asparagine synthase (glutamine-hydrolyzing) [Deltaproteobacteria bacterium]